MYNGRIKGRKREQLKTLKLKTMPFIEKNLIAHSQSRTFELNRPTIRQSSPRHLGKVGGMYATYCDGCVGCWTKNAHRMPSKGRATWVIVLDIVTVAFILGILLYKLKK